MRLDITAIIIAIALGAHANSADGAYVSSDSAPVAHVPHPGHCSSDEFKHTDDLCYSKVFVPTHEFQKVIKGQSIPKGLYVKLSMATGEQMAKLNDGSPSLGAIVTTIDQISSPGNSRQTQFNTQIDPLLHVPIETLSDSQKVERYMTQVSLPTSSDQDIKEALTGLKDIAGDFETGLAVIKHENIDSVINLLSIPQKPALRLEAARVIGVSLQNNIYALKESHKWDIVSKLLSAIEHESDVKALDRQLFALSASVRGDQLELEAFYRSRGDRVLLNVFTKNKQESIRHRILSVMIDVVDPALQPDVPEGLDQEIFLFKKLDPSLKDSISSWCQTLEKESIGPLGELASETLAGLAKIFPNYCYTS